MNSYNTSLIQSYFNRYILFNVIVMMILTSLTSSQLKGQVSTWDGSESSDWFDADNWTPVGIPNVSNDVVVPVSSIDPIIFSNTTAAEAKSLIIDAGATLTVQFDGVGNIINLYIAGSSVDGIQVNGTLINDANIVFETNSASPVLGNGIEIAGVMDNTSNALLFIDNIGGNGINLSTAAASLTNDGSISIGNSTDIGLNGIESKGSIINNGPLTILRSDNYGLFNNGGTFTNNSNLLVHGDVNGIRNSGTFTNEAVIDIFGGANTHIANISGIFTNRGAVEAGDNVDTVGVGILNRASIDNFNTISVYRTETAGIRNEMSGTITNRTFGIIEVNESIADALRNISTASVINESCAVIELRGRLNNTSTNDITNDGQMILDSPSSHIPGNLINNSLIQDEQATLPISNITNNGIVFNPGSQTNSCTTISNVITGSPNGLSIDVYLDQALTMLDGTYDPMTNTYTATTEFNSGLQRRYVQVPDVNNQCSYTIEWNIDVINCDCNASCFSSTAKCWNSNNQIDSLWSNPNNWIPVGVPQQFDHVIIPTDTACNNAIVEYDHTNIDTIHRLDIGFGAQLTIPTGSELPIMNEPGSGRFFRSMFANGGSLINQGSLTLTNGEIHAILNLGTIDNHGDILVDVWGIDPNFDGLDGYSGFSGGVLNNHSGSSLVLKNPNHNGDGMILSGGSVINHPTALIEISNITGVGIEVRSGAFFENKLDGQINIFDILSPSDEVDIKLGAEVIWNGVVDVD